MKRVIMNQRLALYFLLAISITTVAVLPIALSTQGVIAWDVSQEWHPLGALGPILAACLVVYFSLGKSGLLAFLQSLRDRRFSLKLFLFSISPLLVYPIVAVVIPRFSTQTGQGFAQFPLSWWFNLLISALAYGIGEEAGWRGFALPRLQARMNALWAIFILTVIVALWHIPFFFYRFQLSLGTTIGFFIGMLAGAIILTYLYNESGGKTLLPILFHTTFNLVSQASLATVPEVAYVITTLQMVAAVIIVIVYRPTNLATRSRYAIRDDGDYHEAQVGQWGSKSVSR
jgi:uncharacterized protein